MSDKIKVRILADQRVFYDQIVEMTREDFVSLVNLWRVDPNFGKQSIDEDLGGYLDLRDSDSASDVEVHDIYEMKPRKDN
jgi:hypothetical protein